MSSPEACRRLEAQRTFGRRCSAWLETVLAAASRRIGDANDPLPRLPREIWEKIFAGVLFLEMGASTRVTDAEDLFD